MTWDDLARLTNDELFDELEYRLDEKGVRFLNIARGRFLSMERELEQAREDVARLNRSQMSMMEAALRSAEL